MRSCTAQSFVTKAVLLEPPQTLPSLRTLTPPLSRPRRRPSMDSPRYPSPRVPWEVIEQVIDRSRDRPKTLQSLVLTCRQLLPHTRLIIFDRVRFNSRAHVFAFVDFLRENPHLMPVVRSIIIWPPDLAPFPLLSILPSLSEIEFTRTQLNQLDVLPELGLRQSILVAFQHQIDVPPELVLHRSTLTGFQRFGTSIRTLHLSHLHFKTCMSFFRMLIAFVHVTH